MNVKEIENLSVLVSEFGDAMRQKFWKKHREGYRGWNDDSDRTYVLGELHKKLFEHVKRYGSEARVDAKFHPEQLVDIANLCAMLWRIEVQGK